MDLEARKYEFIQKLFDVDEKVLQKLETVLNKESKETQRISLKQYNKEIDEAIEDVENGNFNTQEEAKKIAEKW
ncbi:hypothetical protein [Psychroflexus montanilacus]|uniref:hypothetical protein n=1 Tax=Psychroflexus montanilacus TaxID=2873598 RepID=UPI001CC9C18A|nr:hypothetical protein [Psychroflexus montanilacus]MBZ9651405.1 hypothetical protein [Psychroflexus montanilacus]